MAIQNKPCMLCANDLYTSINQYDFWSMADLGDDLVLFSLDLETGEILHLLLDVSLDFFYHTVVVSCHQRDVKMLDRSNFNDQMRRRMKQELDDYLSSTIQGGMIDSEKPFNPYHFSFQSVIQQTLERDPSVEYKRYIGPMDPSKGYGKDTLELKWFWSDTVISYYNDHLSQLTYYLNQLNKNHHVDSVIANWLMYLIPKLNKPFPVDFVKSVLLFFIEDPRSLIVDVLSDPLFGCGYGYKMDDFLSQFPLTQEEKGHIILRCSQHLYIRCDTNDLLQVGITTAEVEKYVSQAKTLKEIVSYFKEHPYRIFQYFTVKEFLGTTDSRFSLDLRVNSLYQQKVLDGVVVDVDEEVDDKVVFFYFRKMNAIYAEILGEVGENGIAERLFAGKGFTKEWVNLLQDEWKRLKREGWGDDREFRYTDVILDEMNKRIHTRQKGDMYLKRN